MGPLCIPRGYQSGNLLGIHLGHAVATSGEIGCMFGLLGGLFVLTWGISVFHGMSFAWGRFGLTLLVVIELGMK